MPALNPRVFQPGSVGVISRSGSLGTLLCLNLVQAGLGISAFIGIGGDPIIGTTTKDALITLDLDPRTRAVALVGEIGGESYTKAKPALELVLANPRVRCLLVNFCGAFARTDVMTEGVIDAWLALRPKIPMFFTIHGTNEDEAIAMVKKRLGITPFDLMDDAVKAAVEAAR